jgi:hypothetical protein
MSRKNRLSIQVERLLFVTKQDLDLESLETSTGKHSFNEVFFNTFTSLQNNKIN